VRQGHLSASHRGSRGGRLDGRLDHFTGNCRSLLAGLEHPVREWITAGRALSGFSIDERDILILLFLRGREEMRPVAPGVEEIVGAVGREEHATDRRITWIRD